MTRASIGPVLLAVALVGVAAFELWSALDPGPDVPDPAHWQAARDAIAAELQPGDGIRVVPYWVRESAAVLAMAGESVPSEDFDLTWPGDRLFEARHRRLWSVSAIGRDAPEPSGGTLQSETVLPGGIRLQRWALPPSPIVLDLAERIRAARVERWAADAQPRRCRWRSERHACNGQPWEDVGFAMHETAGGPRRCMVLHPYPDRGTVSITFDAIRLDRWLLVRSGFTLESARNEQGSDATLTVRLDGEEVLAREEPKNGWHYRDAWIETSDRQGAEVAVQLEVFAEKEAFRDLCVEALVLRSDTPRGSVPRSP